MKYVLLFVETEKFDRDLQAMSQADRDRAYELVGKWFVDHADKIRGGNKLQPAHTATTVRLDAGSEPVVNDGPFVEGKELIGGFLILEAPDLDSALAWARRLARALVLPGQADGLAVEVRPFRGEMER